MSEDNKQLSPTQRKGNSNTKSLLTGMLILAVGIVLIICNKMITGRGVVVLAGILFLITGIINLILYVTRKDENGQNINKGFSLFFGWLVSIAAMILGICMLVFTTTFNAMIPFIFGLLIFFGAIMLAFTFVFHVRKIVNVPGWLWIAPLAMIVLGIITLTRKPEIADPLIMILTGVSMVIFGVTGALLGILVTGATRRRVQIEEGENKEDANDIIEHGR